MAQFLRPDSNVTQTSFTNGFAAIDESTASDADFAYGANNTAAVLEVGLSNPSATPGSGTTTIRYRVAQTNAGTLDGSGNTCTVTAALYQGATLIATDTARTTSGTWTGYTWTPSVASVTDWTDLRLRFTTSASGGGPSVRRGGAVSWAEVEAPDTNPALSTLTEDFEAGSIDTNKWNTHIDGSGTITQTGGEIVLTPEQVDYSQAGIYNDSVNVGGNYKLDTNIVWIKLVQRLTTTNNSGNGATEVKLWDVPSGTSWPNPPWQSPETYIGHALLTNGTLLAVRCNNGTIATTTITTTWDTDDTPWVGFSISGGTATFWTAPDSGSGTPGTPTSRATYGSLGATYADALIWLLAYSEVWANEGALTLPAKFDGFNTAANVGGTTYRDGAASIASTSTAAAAGSIKAAAAATIASTSTVTANAEIVSNRAALATLSETFNSGTLDTAKLVFDNYYPGTSTPSGADYDITSGKFRLKATSTAAFDSEGRLRSVAAYNAVGSSLTVRVEIGATNRNRIEFSLRIHPVGLNEVQNHMVFSLSEGTFYRILRDGNTAELNQSAIAYSETDHAWWRLEHDGTNLLWKTAPDVSGAPGTFTTLSTYAASSVSWDLTNVKVLAHRRNFGTALDSTTDAIVSIDTINPVTVVYQDGAATIASSSSVTAAGQAVRGGAATIASSSSVTATAAKRVHGAATVASTSTVTAAAAKRVHGAASIESTSTVTAAGEVVAPTVYQDGAATITSTSTVTAAAVKTTHGAALIASVSAVTVAARMVLAGQAAIYGISTVTAAGEAVDGSVTPIDAQAAITAASSGATLDLTNRKHTGQITVNKPLTILGLQIESTTAQTTINVTANDVTLDGLTVLGPSAAAYDSAAIGINASGTSGSRRTGLKIRNCHISRYGNSGISTKFTTDADIRGNTVEDIVYSGMMILSALGGSVLRNTVRRIGMNGTSAANSNNAYGIAISHSTGEARSSDVLVHGNTVEDVPTWQGLDTHGGLRITFTNNIVRGCWRAVFLTWGDMNNEDCVVDGNWLEAPVVNDRWAVQVVWATNATVTNNNMIGWDNGTDVLEVESTGTTISGNYENALAALPDTNTYLDGAASIVSTSAVTAAARRVKQGAATIASTSTAAAAAEVELAPIVYREGAAAIASASTVTAAGQAVRQGAASIASTSAVTAAGTTEVPPIVYRDSSAIIVAISSASASAITRKVWEAVQDTAGAWTEAPAPDGAWTTQATPTSSWG